MKTWGRQWMFEVDATTVDLDMRDVKLMGLTKPAAECCMRVKNLDDIEVRRI